jgi:poly-gamma-glutamate synthesis protein (capsule biosynthesis protein)
MKILFVGDIVLGDEKIHLSDELQKLFHSCDICVCNFEAPIANLAIDKPIHKSGPNIYQSKLAIESIKEIGINLVSLANNHILDYGKDALTETINVIKEQNIDTFGAGFSFEEAYKPYITELNGEKIAFIACAQAEFGVFKSENDAVGYAWVNHHRINTIISNTKKEVDFLYIIIHAGLENVAYPLPEWRIRYKELLDAGADCIVGGHPHIIQGYEVYNNKYIFYSVGNFFFRQGEKNLNDKEWNRSIMVISDTDDISSMKIIPCCVKGNFVDIDKSDDIKQVIAYRSSILLNNELYLSEIDKMVEELWNKYYSMYYSVCFYSFDINQFSIKKIIKYVLMRFLRKTNQFRVIDKTMLLHNIQIETHRWVVERYLYNQNKIHNNL